ncbi:uncharacterized protein LOC106056355 isoform X2 [Biomphalaria glabrata]|nr:uncharacterized protein LOC106056355 isoform X2 [Biomphalaria glabrata]
MSGHVTTLALLMLFVAAGETSEYLKSFQNLFARMPQLQMTAMPSLVVVNFSSIEECSRDCVQQTSFDCRSFDVDNQRRVCLLYNSTHEDGKAFLRESSTTDHYRTAFEKLFNRLPNHVITTKHKKKIQDVSAEQCARRCIFEQDFRCAGFDYEPGYTNCWLTDLTVAQSEGVKFHPGADFYERDFGGALSNFISFGSGSLPYVEEHVMYSKSMFGLDLGACAQLCLTQTTFDCASFDYSFGDRSCQMSRYIASNVGGIDTDNMPTYRVMHYEKKGVSLDRFIATPYSIVPGENDKTLERVSPERCAQACLEEMTFVCRSFDYEIKESTCMLSKKTGSDIGKLFHQGLSQVHHFELKPSLDCGGEMTTSHGDFASPGWPRNYSHHLNCTWTIRVPEHKVIMFTFIHFDLGKKQPNPCGQVSDRLRISEVTPQGEFRFCASPPMTTYISKTNVATFNFVTNGNADAQGFKVVFKGDWPCRAVLRSDRGEIASPQWPEQYPLGLNCVWTIQAPVGAKITLKFTTIDLDSQSYGGCTDQHDYIDVYDGPSAINRVARYCAHETPAPILSTGNALLVTFKTDGYVQRTGFHSSYDFILPPAVDPTTTTTTTTRQPRYDMDEAEDDDQSERLSAKFIEPKSDRESSEMNVTFLADSIFNFGIEGGGYIQPKQQVESDDSNFSTDAYITILWIVLVSLLVITIVLTLVLVVVCKYNR